MLHIRTFPVGPLNCNAYIISNSLDSSAIIIDPGEEGDFLSQQIITHNLNLQAILITHGHFDHILGLLPIHLNFPSVPIYLHEADHFLYKRAVASASHWVGDSYSPDPPPQGLSLKDSRFQTRKAAQKGQSLLGGLVTLPTPGHTPGSVCYHLPDHNLLFSGDTLFKQAVGRTDLSYSDPEKLKTSLKLLSQLPPDTVVYPGHGDPTTIGNE